MPTPLLSLRRPASSAFVRVSFVGCPGANAELDIVDVSRVADSDSASLGSNPSPPSSKIFSHRNKHLDHQRRIRRTLLSVAPWLRAEPQNSFGSHRVPEIPRTRLRRRAMPVCLKDSPRICRAGLIRFAKRAGVSSPETLIARGSVRLDLSSQRVGTCLD
jgi:hypothetical protein